MTPLVRRVRSPSVCRSLLPLLSGDDQCNPEILLYISPDDFEGTSVHAEEVLPRSPRGWCRQEDGDELDQLYQHFTVLIFPCVRGFDRPVLTGVAFPLLLLYCYDKIEVAASVYRLVLSDPSMGDVFGHVDFSWIPSIKSAPMVVRPSELWCTRITAK